MDLCVERARDLCGVLGDSGPLVMLALGVLVAWVRERWKRYAIERETAAKVARLKVERTEAAVKAQRLEVEVASLRPPAMPSTPPAEIELEPDPAANIDTSPQRGQR